MSPPAASFPRHFCAIFARRAPVFFFALALVSTLATACAPASTPTERPSVSPPTGSAGTPGHAPASTDDEQGIAAVLDDWHDAAAKADENRYFAHMTEHAVFLGTDASERWDKAAFRAYASPHFAKGKAWRFRSVRRAIVLSPSAEAAWFDEDLETEKLGPARGSGALVRTSAGWKIAHYNLSVPIPNDRFDVVRRLIAEPPPPESGGW